MLKGLLAAANTKKRRTMLVLDTAYTYDIMLERDVAVLVTGRDLGGYFDHIWTVHPFASLLKPEGSLDRYGRPDVYELAPRHTIIEGRIGRTPRLARFPILNFILAQLDLLHMLLHIVRKHRIRIIRAENPTYNGMMGWTLARLCRLPLMVGVWGNPAEIRRQTGRPNVPRLFKRIWIEEMVERFVLRRTDLVMAQNEDNRRFIVSQGVDRSKTAIFRFGNVLHADHFVSPELRDSGLPDLEQLGIAKGPVILTISRLQQLKLVDHVIKAVSNLKNRGRRVTAIFVGEGPFRAEMEALAAKLGIADRVMFCGNREQTWLARVIPFVSVVASPLTGRALGEAALGGAHVVAYDVDWHSEIIETGKTGELVPYLDYKAMANAIERLLADPERARMMGQNLRKRALAIFDPEVVNRSQVEIYRTFLGNTEDSTMDADIRLPMND